MTKEILKLPENNIDKTLVNFDGKEPDKIINQVWCENYVKNADDGYIFVFFGDDHFLVDEEWIIEIN